MDELELDEEIFKSIILLSEAEEIEKKSAKKTLRTKKEQYNKILEFTKVYNEDSTGKSTLDSLWEKLATELNDIGPPTRTALEWRRVWSCYKYNAKRAESGSGAGSTSSKGKIQPLASQSTSKRVLIEPYSVGSDHKQEQSSTDERMLALLGLLASQQEKIIDNQLATMAKIDRSNELLKQIAALKDINMTQKEV